MCVLLAILFSLFFVCLSVLFLHSVWCIPVWLWTYYVAEDPPSSTSPSAGNIITAFYSFRCGVRDGSSGYMQVRWALYQVHVGGYECDVCMFMVVHTCVLVCTHQWRACTLSVLFLWGRVSPWAWSSQFSARIAVSKSQWLSCSHWDYRQAQEHMGLSPAWA